MFGYDLDRNGCGPMTQWFREGFLSAAIAIGALFGCALPAHAQSLDEAALKLSVMLSRQVNCASADGPFSIAALPVQDSSNALDPNIVKVAGGIILDAARRSALDCVQITEVAKAFDTYTYLQNLGRWAELGTDQRSRVQAELSNADATLTIVLNRLGDKYTVDFSLVELSSGLSLASSRADIPEELLSARCGAAAASETRGLDTLAEEVARRLKGASVLYVEPAKYRDTSETLGYGRYIVDQFVAALSRIPGNVITGASIAVRYSADNQGKELSPGDHTVEMNYWPCEDLSSVRVSIAVKSANGDITRLTQELSLAALPAGIMVAPQTEEKATDAGGAKPTDGGTTEQDFGYVLIEPRLVSVGEVLELSLEPPANCNAFFFNLSPSGRLTPLPERIFDKTEIGLGLFRYDNNESSKYGIIVQPEDEPGIHRLGYICQPSDMGDDGVRGVLKNLRGLSLETNSGKIEGGVSSVVFRMSTYEILK